MELLVNDVVVVIVGLLGTEESIVIDKTSDLLDVLPAISVEVTVKE